MIKLPNIDAIADDVVRTWGHRAQTNVMIEECAELIVALRHYDRGKCGIGDVVSEIADVMIVAHQVAHTCAGADEVQSMVDYKMNRLILKIERANCD